MNTYHGILHVRSANTGSRSEGRYAYLTDAEGAERKLCRRDAAPFDDPFFEPFDGRRVEIEGTVRHGWLAVDAIVPAEETPEQLPAAEAAAEPETQEESAATDAKTPNDNPEKP